MGDVRQGSCLCGAVRFAVEGDFDGFFLCHCSRCRKDTGSAHAANLFANAASLTWLAGEDRIVHFDLPGTRHTKAFCKTCGSALPRQQESGGLMVPAGSLDTPVGKAPDAHIFLAERADWDEDLHGVQGFDGLPS